MSLSLPLINLSPKEFDVADGFQPIAKITPSWLLRLLESDLFNMSLGIQYFFCNLDPQIKEYIVNRFYCFNEVDVDFYLPQLVTLFSLDLNESYRILRPYFVFRAMSGSEFSVRLVWLLTAFSQPTSNRASSDDESTFTNSSNFENEDSTNNNVVMINNIASQSISNLRRLLLSEEFYCRSDCHLKSSGNNDNTNINYFHSDFKVPVKPLEDNDFVLPADKQNTDIVINVCNEEKSSCTSSSSKRSDSSKTDNHFEVNPTDQLHGDSAPNSSLSKKLSISQFTLDSILSIDSNGQSNAHFIAAGKHFFYSQKEKNPENLATEDNKKISDFLENKRINISDLKCSQPTDFDKNQYTLSEVGVNENLIADEGKHSFKNACQCSLMVQSIRAELEFVRLLLRLAHKLRRFSSRDERTAHLHAEIERINRNLPARVWLPVHGANHHVLRLATSSCACLNSKDKAPYIMYVEVMDCGLAGEASHLVSSDSGLDPGTKTAGNPANTSGISSYLDRLAVEAELSQQNNSEHFAAKDVRRRLSRVSSAPSSVFKRDPDDPSAALLKEPWTEKSRRLKAASPFGHLPGWQLLAVIVKYGDDLRQDHIAYQFMSVLKNIWKEEGLSLWLRPLNVVVISKQSGMIEPILNAVSLHQIKRHSGGKSLLDYFLEEFGPVQSKSFQRAQHNFVTSCAAYCILCYLLQVKDRHNGNILLDSEGHMIHIDYGFLLSISPGRNLGFEASPFKLTAEFVQVMSAGDCDWPADVSGLPISGGGGGLYPEFCRLMLQGFLSARKHLDKLVSVVEPIQSMVDMPCFSKPSRNVGIIKALRNRFHLNLTEAQLKDQIDLMIRASLNSLTTKLYDKFQYYSNGIL